MPQWNDGDEAAQLLAEEDKKRRGSGRFRVQQLPIKKGDDFFFRPYTDRRARGDHPGWVSVDLHQFCDTKPKPEDYQGENWPKMMWGVCPLDRMFRVYEDGKPTDAYEPGYGDCYLHNALAGVKDEKFGFDKSRPSAQVLGLGVLREPVFNSQGACTGFRDKTAEWVDDQGNVTKIPHLVILNQRYEQFWAPIAAACFLDKTACNKDFQVKRGDKWTVQAVNTDREFFPGTPAWEATYDATLALVEFDLRQYVLDHASLDHYKRWFIPGAIPEGGYGRRDRNGASAVEPEDSGGVAANGTPVADGVDQSVMANFRASLADRGAK